MNLAIGLTPLGLGIVSILVADASAQAGRGDPARLWAVLAERHDKDKDGKITAREYARGEDKFRNWDSDGDGVLTEADFESLRRGRGKRRGRNRGGNTNSILARLVARPADINKDGRVTAGEWHKFCERLDCNQDGILSRAEFPDNENLSDRRFGMLRRALDEDRDGSVQHREIAAVFQQLDRNKNKVLCRAEMGGNRSRGGRGRRGRSNEPGVPQPGQPAPDFDLPLLDQPADQPPDQPASQPDAQSKGARPQATIKLSSFAGKKPVALIFGSYT